MDLLPKFSVLSSDVSKFNDVKVKLVKYLYLLECFQIKHTVAEVGGTLESWMIKKNVDHIHGEDFVMIL